jgi:hypothetical protein
MRVFEDKSVRLNAAEELYHTKFHQLLDLGYSCLQAAEVCDLYCPPISAEAREWITSVKT